MHVIGLSQISSFSFSYSCPSGLSGPPGVKLTRHFTYTNIRLLMLSIISSVKIHQADLEKKLKMLKYTDGRRKDGRWLTHYGKTNSGRTY